MSADQRRHVTALREAPATRAVVADGATGTMLQAQQPTPEDFENLDEDCNEILNLTRPDIVRPVHCAYCDAGADGAETNTFGANHSAAPQYDIAHRVHEPCEAAAPIAREIAGEHTEIHQGEIRCARDAFEGLQRRVRAATVEIDERPEAGHVRPDAATDNPIPTPPFRGIQPKEYTSRLDEGALFTGQWGPKQARTGDGPTYEELAESEGRPTLRGPLNRLQRDNPPAAAGVHGHFPGVSNDEDLIVPDDAGNERTRFTSPHRRRSRRLRLAGFCRPQESGERDAVGFQIVTAGSRNGQETARMFKANTYRDHLEPHALSVQPAKALAEYGHTRVRCEPGLSAEDPALMRDMSALKYRGARFCFGYGACPDPQDRAKITQMLQPQRIGIHLSQKSQLHPEQSTHALVNHHPQTKHFNTGGRS